MARKGEPNYHNQMFLSLLQFVRTMSNASKIQLTDAIKSANLYVADFSMTATHRAKVKKLIPLMRAELKGFAKGRQINPRKKNPEIEIRELILFSENLPAMHNQYVSIMKNLSRKKKRGVYDPKLAAKLWKYWIDEGVKQYNKEVLGGGYSLKQSVFTMEDRKQAAIEMEDQEQEGVFSMEYLKLNNPSHKKNPATINRERFLLMVKEIQKFTKDEMFAFSTKHQRGRGAMGLGFSGKGSRTLVNDLANFAANMGAAKGTTGDTKKMYERIAHDILTDATKTEYKARKKNPRQSRQWQIFKCKGNDVRFLGTMTSGEGRWFTTRGDGIKTDSKVMAVRMAKAWAHSDAWKYGITPVSKSLKQIIAGCKKGKV